MKRMMTSRMSRPGIAAFSTLLIAACSGSPPARQATPTGGASDAEIEALYRARTDSARMRFTGADVHFISMMIGHHAQALIMSRMAPSHGASDAVLRLTSRIINAQNDEIATMQHWLRDRGQHVPEVHLDGLKVLLDDSGRAVHMHGMLNEEEMRALDAARGHEFDRLFLTGMIKHHSGAVDMVRDLFATDGAAQDEMAFKLANDIQVDQITEIERMKLMLAAVNAQGREP
jgi:uncharacterized protein (DUF305 family)